MILFVEMLLFLLCLSVVLGGPLQGRIVGGQLVDLNQDPKINYQVALLAGGSACGGVIIDKEYVLTAAHCLETNGQIFGFGDVMIRPGISFNNAGIGISKYWIHPSYLPNTQSRGAQDLAIVKLSQNLTFSNSIGVAALPSANCAANVCIGPGVQYIVSGYGLTMCPTTPGQSCTTPSNDLAFVAQQFVSLNDCNAAFPNPSAANLQDNIICAGPAAGDSRTDSCQGDSGGKRAFEINFESNP